MRQLLQSLFAPSRYDAKTLEQIRARMAEYTHLTDNDLRAAVAHARSLVHVFALTAIVASRLLGQDMYDVQFLGAMALARGSIAEMQTGEGKTLAAVPAVVCYALRGEPVHVMTVNDYLARRDAEWMGEIYRFFNLSVGCIQQGMSPAERRSAYARDITYATPNEIGFDVLRDRLALHGNDQVHRPFGTAVIDEADSILIDEARIPLVIAGGSTSMPRVAHAVDWVVRQFKKHAHYTVDTGRYNVALTDAGIRAVENAFGCGNLFNEENLLLHTAVQDALDAHVLLRRDVDYIVKNGEIDMIDEFKGRVAIDRRWPAGLQSALDAKEGLWPKLQGMVLGTITLQHLVALYPRICGMTGTAATQPIELKRFYGLDVEVIPTNRPVIRQDYPDEVFATREEKEEAVASEVRRVHDTGQPVLVGTASVEDSYRISRLLWGVRHNVLNALNDEYEAQIIAAAGQRGAVTVSTKHGRSRHGHPTRARCT
jgi:preprotein translocase subunit SecA